MTQYTRKKIGLFLTLLLPPLLFVYLLMQFSTQPNQTPRALQGMIDLSNWDFEKDGVVPLDGEWEIYWNQLLTYSDFHDGTVLPKQHAIVPSIWNNTLIRGNSLPGEGFATYRLKVKTNTPALIKALKIKTMSSAYALSVNNTLVAASGIVGKDAASTHPAYKPQIAFFQTGERDFEIILHVANFTFARGGPWYSIYLGTDQQILALRDQVQQKDLLLLGAIFIMALYHLAIFFLQRRYQYRAELYLVLILVLFFIVIACRGEYVILPLLPSLSIYWLVFLQYSAMYWGSTALALFMRELYPDECSNRVTNVLLGISVTLTLIAAVTPIAFYTKFLLYLQLHFLLVTLYYTYIAWKAALKNRGGAVLLFSAITFAIGAFLLDVSYYWKIRNSHYEGVFPLVSLGLLSAQAFILAQRSSNSFAEVDILSKRLLSLNKQKDDFLANTSHELRTPLHGIIAITESVLATAAHHLPQQQQHNLELVVSSGKRLSYLVNDILAYEKLKHNDIQLHTKPVDIRKIIPATLEVVKYLIFAKPISLINRIPDELPYIVADENRITQIIYNLLGNAIKYTEQGSITISAVQNKEMLEISVTDTGIGISADKLDAVFKSFEQLDMSLADHYGSTGLGLSVTKYLVEVQGGKIWVASEPGKGSTFTFSIPASSVKPASVHPQSANAAMPLHFDPPSVFSLEGDFTILIVDDDYVNLQALINILATKQYSSITATTGRDALAILEQNINIDLVILDVMLPDMSGHEVCRKIRETYSLSDLPVLMMTAQNSAQSMLAGFASGTNDFLDKPFDSSELKARMKTLLHLKKSAQQALQSEMAFLQAQIKPHFLYNALNTIIAFCWTDAEKAGQLLLALSNYLRSSFNFNNMNQFSSLEKELEFVGSYLTIEKARFEEKLNCRYDISIPLDGIMIPNLMLQPLVENAIKHGLLPKKDGGTVIISIKQQAASLCITVQDDGIGIPQEKLATLLTRPTGNSVGLMNIDRRLKRLYGHGLSISSETNSGTLVTITIPCESEEASHD